MRGRVDRMSVKAARLMVCCDLISQSGAGEEWDFGLAGDMTEEKTMASSRLSCQACVELGSHHLNAEHQNQHTHTHKFADTEDTLSCILSLDHIMPPDT